MDYVVRWLGGDAVVAESRFDDLTEAKAHARERFAANRDRRGVTVAEVSAGEGTIYLRIFG